VIVDRDGEDFLGAILANYVVIERRFDVGRLGDHERQGRGRLLCALMFVVGQGLGAALNALLTDQQRRRRLAGAAGVWLGTGGEVLNCVLTLAAERTEAIWFL